MFYVRVKNMFKGCHTALITPMNGDGSVDYDGLERLVEFQISNGISGVLAVGTTGESPTLLWDEHNQVIERTVTLAKNRCLSIAGTGSNSTKETIIDKCKELDGEATELIELYESNKNHIFQKCPLHVSVTHPYTGQEWIIGAPWRVNGKRPIPSKPAPVLGESNNFIFRSIMGLDDHEIAELETKNLEKSPI